jgi:hypothetical protein
MLAPLMRRVAMLALLALVAGVAAGCGDEEPTGVAGPSIVPAEAVEGEPLDLDELSYNIQITRFLNPDDAEDAEYLVGQPPEQPGTSYLGVFLVIENETEEARPSASGYTVVDTVGNEFEPAESESPYAIDIGAEVPPEDQLPLANTTAATGPNQGALLTFLVSDEVSDNRPLVLEIETEGGAGEVILDI